MTNRAITISAKSSDKKPFPIEVKMEAAWLKWGKTGVLEAQKREEEPLRCDQIGSENTAKPSAMATIRMVISCHHLFAVDAHSTPRW